MNHLQYESLYIYIMIHIGGMRYGENNKWTHALAFLRPIHALQVK